MHISEGTRDMEVDELVQKGLNQVDKRKVLMIFGLEEDHFPAKEGRAVK